MARLYIGNLPHVTAEHELQAWVEQYGFKVESVQVIRDLETGASRGFAFVELPEVLRARIELLQRRARYHEPVAREHVVCVQLIDRDQVHTRQITE